MYSTLNFYLIMESECEIFCESEVLLIGHVDAMEKFIIATEIDFDVELSGECDGETKSTKFSAVTKQ